MLSVMGFETVKFLFLSPSPQLLQALSNSFKTGLGRCCSSLSGTRAYLLCSRGASSVLLLWSQEERGEGGARRRKVLSSCCSPGAGRLQEARLEAAEEQGNGDYSLPAAEEPLVGLEL